MAMQPRESFADDTVAGNCGCARIGDDRTGDADAGRNLPQPDARRWVAGECKSDAGDHRPHEQYPEWHSVGGRAGHG